MKKQNILPVLCLLTALPLGAQSLLWHKKIDRRSFAAPPAVSYCRLEHVSGQLLVSTQNRIIQFDPAGAATGHLFLEPSGSSFTTGVLKKESVGSKHPYLVVARRFASPASGYRLAQYLPGTGIQHETSFADSLGNFLSARPYLLETTDNALLVVGGKFYRKILFSESGGFTEEWSRPLPAVPSAVQIRSNGIVCGAENGKLFALDAGGNLLWEKQHNLKFRNLKVLSDGSLIACGDDLSAAGSHVVKIAGDGSVIWSKDFPESTYNEVVASSDGGFAAVGSSALHRIVLLKLNGSGDQSWKREYGNDTGFSHDGGGSLVQWIDGGFVVAGKLLSNIVVLKTDAMGNTSAEALGPIEDRFLQTPGVQVQLFPKASMLFNGKESTFTFPADSGRSAVLALSPWLAGKDVAGNLKLAADDYGLSSDFRAGLANASVQDLTRTWRVDRSEIRRLREDFLLDQSLDEPVPYDILTWPARGNPYLTYNLDFSPVQTDAQRFPAPFVDANGNGIYNVYDGDYPKIKGDQMVWWPLTDETAHERSHGDPLVADLYVSVYTQGCVQNPLLNKSLFIDFQLVNRSVESYEDAYIACFTDFDLGCFQDDYIGSIPSANACYVYNADGFDNTNCQAKSFGSVIPVQTVQYLNHSLDHAMYFTNPSVNNPSPPLHDPDQPGEFFNLLQSKWKDGVSLTAGGSGYNPGSSAVTNFMFSGNPSDPQGWSMCSELLSYSDQRTLTSHGPLKLLPDESYHLEIGLTLHDNIPHPCPDIFGLVKPSLDKIQSWSQSGAIDLNTGLAPVYTLTPGQPVALNASAPNASFAWSTGATTPGIFVSAPGQYSVTITGETGCTAVEEVLVTLGTATGEPASGPEWRILPNPVQDFLRIDCEKCGAGDLSARIFNAQGQLMGQHRSPSFDVRDLPPAMYWVELQLEGRLLGSKKFVKRQER